MFRIVERDSRDVLRSGFETEKRANDVVERYEQGDMQLGIFTEDFYEVEEYQETE